MQSLQSEQTFPVTIVFLCGPFVTKGLQTAGLGQLHYGVQSWLSEWACINVYAQRQYDLQLSVPTLCAVLL